MAKNKHAKIGRPTKGEGPKLSNPDEVERLLVEGEVVPDEHGEAKRGWPPQRDVAARFRVAVRPSAAVAKKHPPPERREDPSIQDRHRMVACPADPDHLWVQHHNGVFRSTDGAASWSEVASVRPSVFGFGAVCAGFDAGVFALPCPFSCPSGGRSPRCDA